VLRRLSVIRTKTLRDQPGRRRRPGAGGTPQP
jgi:hypothetical protein